jgi:TldD protein
MRDIITDAFKSQNAEYIDVHLEESTQTVISFHGNKLEEVSQFRSCGGNARALVKGGWGFIGFNDQKDLREKITIAVTNGRLVNSEPFSFSSPEPVVDSIDYHKDKQIKTITLTEKMNLLSSYNDIMLRHPGIQSTVVRYSDKSRKTIFANSNGSYIEQSYPDLTLRLTAISRRNNEVQQSSISVGSRDGFSKIEALEDQAHEIAQKAHALTEAPYVKGGEYTVVLDPILAGVFTHEAFGHLSEADFIYQNKQLRDIMVLGHRFGSKSLNIIDEGSLQDLRGGYRYDDEGTPSTKTYLIREGILTGRLHSLETASRMGEAPTGNARALNFRFPPIVRMSNTYIDKGNSSLEDMIGDIKEGIYVKGWYGGTTSLEMFTFSSGEAYMIRNGEIEELLRPVVLTGNVFTTLDSIDAIGDDLEMNEGGGCGKFAQSPLPVSNGSPHIRIRNCVVGGH